MPKSDFIQAVNIVEQEKGVEMKSKSRKIGDASEVAEMQNAVVQNHVGFNNKMFGNVGGGAIHAAAQQGGCLIGMRGEGAFTGSSGDADMFSKQLEMAAKRKEESKEEETRTPDKNKVADLELLGQRLEQKLTDNFDKNQKKIVAAEQEKTKADKIVEPSDGPSRLAGNHMIVGLAVAKERMDERASLLSYLNVKRATLPGFLLLFTLFSLLFTSRFTLDNSLFIQMPA